jgi:prepilin-type N-terminal cleavage/methylation domain-containing protein
LSCTRSSKGFTLLELLIAVAISSVVVLLSYSFFNVVERSGKFAVEGGKVISFVPPLYYLFLKDFESANQSYGGFVVRRELDGKLKSFSFYTENCYYYRGICKVKYWFYEGPRGRRLLFRSEYRLRSLEDRGISVPVSFKLKGLELFRLSGSNWVKFNGGRLSLVKLLVESKEGEIPLVFKVRT